MSITNAMGWAIIDWSKPNARVIFFTFTKLFLHELDEILLLTTFGVVLLVGGLAHRLQVSATIGAEDRIFASYVPG